MDTENVTGLPVQAASGELDLDGWIAGTCGMIRTAKVFQRGDLLARLDELKREIEIAKDTPKEQRGVNDASADTLMDEWERIASELDKSAMVMHVQDRTGERRRHLRERLIKEVKLDPEKEDDEETIGLHLLADAIVKVQIGDKVKDYPDGFPPNQLRAILQKVGDSGLFDLRDAYYKVISEAPTVTAPLSRPHSSSRGGIT